MELDLQLDLKVSKFVKMNCGEDGQTKKHSEKCWRCVFFLENQCQCVEKYSHTKLFFEHKLKDQQHPWIFISQQQNQEPSNQLNPTLDSSHLLSTTNFLLSTSNAQIREKGWKQPKNPTGVELGTKKIALNNTDFLFNIYDLFMMGLLIPSTLLLATIIFILGWLVVDQMLEVRKVLRYMQHMQHMQTEWAGNLNVPISEHERDWSKIEAFMQKAQW